MSANTTQQTAERAGRAPFVHLRLHTAFSLAEGAISIKQAAALCRQYNMPALAITDTNNLFGALEFATTLSSEGIQPIIGCSLNVSLREELNRRDGLSQRRGRRNDVARPLALLAMSERGYLNLSALSSLAYVQNLEQESGDLGPHLTLEQLARHGEGLIALTGGRNGPVDFLIRERMEDEARELLARLATLFGDRLYIELQRHGDQASRVTEPVLLDLAARRGLPLVATNEPYFATPDIYEAHDALLCIADGAYLAQENRRRVTPQHYFKSGAEMAMLFKDLPQAVDHAAEIAMRCAFMPETRDPILPRFKQGGKEEEAAALRALAEEGLRERLKSHPPSRPEQEYWDRLEYELDVITRMKFPGYFLIVADFIKWAKARGIPVGPGRGSGAGSLVAWALTITDLDPLRFNLLFERFLNPERISMPDFDIDFCQDRRDEVIGYVQDKYGADRVAQIITFGKLQARAVVRDVGRVLGMPYGQVDRISKMIPHNPANPVSLEDALDSTPELRHQVDADESVARLIEIALKLEGLYRHASTHAAGLVIGDRPLEQLVPLYRDPRADMPVTQFNLNWVEPAGLVKFDFLGLKTLTVLDRARKLLARRGIDLDLSALPFDDEKTYDMLARGDSVGVFQFESAGMRDLLRQAVPTKFEDLIALVALFRPGPMENIPKYLACKHGREKPEFLHELVSPVVADTYGVIIYQEQVMQIAQKLSGYTLGEADILRKAMGKKKKEEMDLQKDRFIAGAVKNGVNRQQADYIFELVAKFAGYGFNKCHSACYAYVAYQTAYVKANFPVEFYAASMSLDMTNTDKLYTFYSDAARHEIEVVPPDINLSEAEFSTGGGKVVYALAAIKNVGRAAMDRLCAERAANGSFKDIFDFATRLDSAVINKRQIENLAKAGAFDSVFENRAQLFDNADLLSAFSAHAQTERESSQSSLFGEEVEASARPNLRDVPPWPPGDRLTFEKEAIGYYLSGHPLDRFEDMLRDRNVAVYADIRSAPERTSRVVRLAGIVHAVRERRSKNDRPFAFTLLSDPSSDYEVTMFSDVLEQCRDILRVGTPLLLTCAAEWDGDDLKLLVKSVRSLEEFNAVWSGGFKVYVDTQDGIDAVQKVLGQAVSAAEAARAGEGPVHLVLLPRGGSGEMEVRLPLSYPVSFDVKSALKSAAGVVDVVDL